MLALLLLLANLAFVAWTQGLLSPLARPPMSSEREPERLAQQVRPESVKVIDTKDADKIEQEQARVQAARAAQVRATQARAAPAVASAASQADPASAPR